MKSKEFFAALDALESEKNIKKEKFISALESGLTAAFKKMYGESKSALVELNADKQTINIYSYKTVVELVQDPDKEISLEDARLIKKSHKIGDMVKQEESSKGFGRVPSQNVKHVIMQKLKEIVRQQDYAILSDKEGNLISAQILREDNMNFYLNMGGMEAEGILPKKAVMPSDNFQVGDKIKVYVRKILDLGTGTQLQVSRTHPDFVRRLFELEIPEIQSGELEIVDIARESGFRTKIAIKSMSSSVDPVGACVGNRGTRISAILSELGNEKVDIIPYSDNIAVYIANSLSPAKVESVTINELQKSSVAVVPDDKLSLAIGRSGQNVRLAAKLVHWKIDVRSKSQMEKIESGEVIDDSVPGVEISDEELFGDL